MTAKDEPSSDADELLALSCLHPEAAPVFFSLVQRAPTAVQLVKTNPVLFALLSFEVSRRELTDEALRELVGRKKRDLVGWLGGINQEAGVKFVERFEVPSHLGEFERTLRRISDEELLQKSTSRPLSEVFQERRHLETAPELGDLRPFRAELREKTKTIGPSATSRLIAEIEQLGLIVDRDVWPQISRCKSGAALRELRQALLPEVHEVAPERLQELPSYPQEFPRAPAPASATILPIVNEHELLLEGKEMNHCVGRLSREFQQGDAFLFRVLEPERATLKLKQRGHRLVVEELKLANNEEPSPATYAAVETWLGDLG